MEAVLNHAGNQILKNKIEGLTDYRESGHQTTPRLLLFAVLE